MGLKNTDRTKMNSTMRAREKSNSSDFVPDFYNRNTIQVWDVSSVL
jgi:hypothetical protein